MKYAALGTSGLHVSRIGIGTMTFGSPLSEAESARLVCSALDRGINFFDTADVYEGYSRTWGSAGGVSEAILGRALEGRRDQAVICTKFGNPAGMGPLDGGLARRHLEKQLEASLRRLRTDHVDVFVAHRWDGSVAMEEFLGLCERWVRSGKARAVGASNWPVWRIAQAMEMSRASGGFPLQVLSPKYNLMRRGVELEQTACALHYGSSLAGYQPLEAGILSGKYRRGRPAPAGSRGEEAPRWLPRIDAAVYDKLEGLAGLAGGRLGAGSDGGVVAGQPGPRWGRIERGCDPGGSRHEACSKAGQETGPAPTRFAGTPRRTPRGVTGQRRRGKLANFV